MKASHIHVIVVFVNSLKNKKVKPESSTSWNRLGPEHTQDGWSCWRSPPLKMGPGCCPGSQGSQRPSHQHSVCEQGGGPPGLPH